MKKIMLGKTGLNVPEIAVGCMRIGGMEAKDITDFLRFCIENGLNFFDHADIYGRGQCEINFAKAFKETGYKREDVIIQSKCAIVPKKMYDFSREHIINSVDSILTRLETEYLDILLLHRHDALCEPEEVAEAFDELEKSGKVRHFGVSNHRPLQIELLKKCVRQDININQMQLSIPFSNMIASGIEANMVSDGAVDRDGEILNYCRLNDITIQAWSPFQGGYPRTPFIGDTENYPKLNATLNEIAEKYNVTPTSIAAAWILRHPARIQLVSGSTRISRIKEILDGSNITLTREEWYRLYIDAGHILP